MSNRRQQAGESFLGQLFKMSAEIEFAVVRPDTTIIIIFNRGEAQVSLKDKRWEKWQGPLKNPDNGLRRNLQQMDLPSFAKAASMLDESGAPVQLKYAKHADDLIVWYEPRK